MSGSVKKLVLLAFAGSLGLTFLLVACAALPNSTNWYPLFFLFFYVLAPVPLSVARRHGDGGGASSSCRELAVFLTAGLVVSAFGLPLVLAHAAVIRWAACALVLAGNVVMFLATLGFFVAFDSESEF